MAERPGGGNDSCVMVYATSMDLLDSDVPDSRSSVDGSRVYADCMAVLLRRAELVAPSYGRRMSTTERVRDELRYLWG